MGNFSSNSTGVWVSRSINGDGECAGEPYRFSANGGDELGKQTRRHEYGVSEGGFGGNQHEVIGRDAMDQSKEIVCDGGQSKIDLTTNHGSRGESAQVSTILQHSSSDEGDELGHVGTFVEAMSREGKYNGIDGMVGMDCEEGGRDVVSSS